MKIINFVYYTIIGLLIALQVILLGWAAAGVALTAAHVSDFWKVSLLIMSGVAAVFASYWVAVLGSKLDSIFARTREDYKEFENYKLNKQLKQMKASTFTEHFAAQEVHKAAQHLEEAKKDFAHIYDKKVNELTQSRKKAREEREEIEVEFKEMREELNIPRDYFVAENTADKVVEELQKRGGLNA